MTDEFIGKTINGYEVQGIIGQGGMATVYSARQQSMNRTIALKVLPRQFVTDDTYLQRFEREVRIVSQLEHRNIVPVYDYGEWDGLPYIAMRYLPQGSVDVLLRQGPLPMGRIMSIIAQIAPALDYAHSKDVLHRDLKPSNVLLDEADGAFLTDFGIARLANEAPTGITTQGVVGTPSYMSPEQAQGRPMDGRSDVYSLGVMLFEMATGRRPFLSDTPYSIAVMQVTEAPPMPRSIHPGLSLAVERVILKALRKNPNERYQTAQELADALQGALENPDKINDTQPNLKSLGLPQPAVMASPASRPSGQKRASIGADLRQKRQSNPLLALFVGGAMGCGLLGVVIILGLFAIGGLLTTSTTPPAPTLPAIALETPFGVPTLDATSASARETLIARSANNDATLTASAQTPMPGDGDDERLIPTLRPNLRAVTGELVYSARRNVGGTDYFQIIKLNLATWQESLLTEHPSDNSYPIASPDGRWIAFQSNREGNFDIYVMNTLGGQLTRLTDTPYIDRLAGWSPDSAWVVYSSDVRQDNTFDLYRTRIDGRETELVYSNNQRKSHPRYSPDGRYLVFTMGANAFDSRTWEIARLDLTTNDLTLLTNNDSRDASPVFHPDGGRILYVAFRESSNGIAEMDVDGRNSRMLYDSVGSDWSASYSPDGRFIAFTSNVSGDDQLYLMTSEGTDAQQLTFDGGNSPAWIPPITDEPR